MRGKPILIEFRILFTRRTGRSAIGLALAAIVAFALTAATPIFTSSVVGATNMAGANNFGVRTKPQDIELPTCNVTITTNVGFTETWYAAFNPYCVNPDIEILPGATLTIEAGVTVYFLHTYSGIHVNHDATLNAIGSEEHPIIFTPYDPAPHPDDWIGIRVFDGGAAHFRYIDLGYAGAGYGTGLRAEGVSTLEVRDSRIHDNNGNGLGYWGSQGSDYTITDTTFDHNSGVPIYENHAINCPTDCLLDPTYTNLTFNGNGKDYLLINGGDLYGSRIFNGPASFNGKPVVFNGGGVDVSDGHTLTIQAGTLMEFTEPGGGVRVHAGGHLVVNGAPGNLVTFTSDEDVKAPNQWMGVIVENGGVADLDYSDIGYGGHDYGMGLRAEGQSSLDVHHSRIHDNNGNGLNFFGSQGSDYTITDTTIDHNSGVPIYENHAINCPTDCLLDPTYTNLTFDGNGKDYLLINGGDLYGSRTFDSPASFNGKPIVFNGGGVDVSSGHTLTIEAGTLMEFTEPGGGVRVHAGGHLVANGAPGNLVTFTSDEDVKAPNQWMGVFVENGGVADLDYADIGYAGHDYGMGLRAEGQSSLDVHHSRIHDNNGNGLNFFGSQGSDYTITDTTIDHNSGVPIYENHAINCPTDCLLDPTYTNLTFDGNGKDYLLINGGDLYGSRTFNGPASFNGKPIVFNGGGVDVSSGHTLTIEAGTLMEFTEPGGGVRVHAGGSLVANGAAGNLVTFTSDEDVKAPNQWMGVFVENGGHASLSYCDIGYAGHDYGVGLWVTASDVQVSQCRIHHNNGNGIRVDSTHPAPLWSNVISDNTGNGLYLTNSAQVEVVHTTLARNTTGVWAEWSSTATLTNTILSVHATGVYVDNSSSVNLTQTLWDQNTVAVSGSGAFSETGHFDGAAWFAEDGFHITRYSSAIGKGVNAGSGSDIDGQPRPLPANSPPDLGADEYPYTPGQDFAAEKTAFKPEWTIWWNPGTGYPEFTFRQRYYIRYFYGTSDQNPPDLTISITDQIPAGMTFDSETHSPEMTLLYGTGTLTWLVDHPVQAGMSGEIILSLVGNPAPGTLLDNQGTLVTQVGTYPLEAITEVPLFPPQVTEPGDGEMCPGDQINVRGVAQPGMDIRVFENDTQVALTTVSTDGSFLTSFVPTHAGIDLSTALTVKACMPGDPSHCSDATLITLTQQTSFWCPQRSSWEGTPSAGPLAGQHLVYQFKDSAGKFSTQNWRIPGVYGFWNTNVHIQACNCPNTGILPTAVWMLADGTRYDPLFPGPLYDINIPGAAHTVVFWAQCGSVQVSSNGDILIDPDGYVFDASKGFDVTSPTQNALSDVTVSAYVLKPEWGGWVLWPGNLYNNQVNPQKTGPSGYFAFFTPPGQYFLKAEDKAGYQSWRSPVITVTDAIMHANIPLTPLTSGVVHPVILLPSGPDQATLNIQLGDIVEWSVPVPGMATPQDLILATENPILRLLSLLNPLTLFGWDSGLLVPSQTYRRQFNQAGRFTYSDSAGHTAVVVVTGNLYLPMVSKR